MMRSRSGGRSGLMPSRRRRLAIEDGVEDFGGAVAAEGKLARGHFVEDGAEGEEIGAGVEILGAGLLGGHVGDGAESAARAGEVVGVAAIGGESFAGGGFGAGAGDFGETEVENFGLAAGGDEDVGGLDVAVDDAFGVGGVEGIGNVDGDFEKRIEFEGAAGDGVLEGFAFEAFHGDEGAAVFFADVVDGADVGVIESGGGLGFALEADQGLRIFRDGVGEEFQSDETAEAGVFGFEDDTHATPAEFFEDAVVGDDLTNCDWGFGHVGASYGARKTKSTNGGLDGVVTGDVVKGAPSFAAKGNQKAAVTTAAGELSVLL